MRGRKTDMKTMLLKGMPDVNWQEKVGKET